MYAGIEHPQIVVVLDPSLLSIVDVTKGAPDDAVVLVNSEMSPAELRKHYGLKGFRLLHDRRHPDRRRDDPPPDPQHAHGRRADAHHRAVPDRRTSSTSCARTSARSSRPRSWRATSPPSRAATRRSRANDRREEGRGQEAGPSQEAERPQGRRQEAQVGHQRRRQLGPRAARARRHHHRGGQLRLQRDRRLAQRGAGHRRGEVRRLHAVLLLLPRRLHPRRERQGRRLRPRALQGLRHLRQGVPARRHRHEIDEKE